MEQLQDLVNKYAQNLPVKIRTDPLNEIHIPSLIIGLSITTVLSPLMNLLIGTVLSSLVTLLKYLIIISTGTATLLIITSKHSNNNDIDNNKNNSKGIIIAKQYRKHNYNTGTFLDKENSREAILNYTINSVHQDFLNASPTNFIAAKENDEGHTTKPSPPGKEDFEGLKYYNIPITKSRRPGKGELLDGNNPYENFVNMANTINKSNK